jgi:hypothetical protein
MGFKLPPNYDPGFDPKMPNPEPDFNLPEFDPSLVEDWIGFGGVLRGGYSNPGTHGSGGGMTASSSSGYRAPMSKCRPATTDNVSYAEYSSYQKGGANWGGNTSSAAEHTGGVKTWGDDTGIHSEHFTGGTSIEYTGETGIPNWVKGVRTAGWIMIGVGTIGLGAIGIGYLATGTVFNPTLWTAAGILGRLFGPGRIIELMRNEAIQTVFGIVRGWELKIGSASRYFWAHISEYNWWRPIQWFKKIGGLNIKTIPKSWVPLTRNYLPRMLREDYRTLGYILQNIPKIFGAPIYWDSDMEPAHETGD